MFAKVFFQKFLHWFFGSSRKSHGNAIEYKSNVSDGVFYHSVFIMVDVCSNNNLYEKLREKKPRKEKMQMHRQLKLWSFFSVDLFIFDSFHSLLQQKKPLHYFAIIFNFRNYTTSSTEQFHFFYFKLFSFTSFLTFISIRKKVLSWNLLFC